MWSRSIPSANIDAWTLAEGDHDGKPSLLRFRPELKRFLGDKRYPRRLTITWAYADPDGDDLPDNETTDLMRDFEDRVVDAIERDSLGVLAFVYTFAGDREWHIYLADAKAVGAALNDALAEMPRLPIQIEATDDPAWEELKSVLDGVTED